MSTDSVAFRIRHWREIAGLSKAQLAKELGVHASNVTYWEAGKTSPTLENLMAIARACGVELRTFFGDIPPAAASG